MRDALAISRCLALCPAVAGYGVDDNGRIDGIFLGRADAGAAAVASAHAPFVYFDAATISGINAGGVAPITPEAIRRMSGDLGEPLKDFAMVCHPRMDLNAQHTGPPEGAIKQIETLVRPAPQSPATSRGGQLGEREGVVGG